MAVTVYFEEHEDSPQESGSREGKLSFTRIFLTAWADRWTFVFQLFSSGTFGNPGSYSSLWPGVVADSFSIARLINAPNSASITDPTTQQLTHDTLAKITVTYTPLAFDFDSQNPEDEQLPQGTWATYNQSGNVEFLSISGRAMKWDSDSEKLPADVAPVVPQMLKTHQVTWSQVKFVPWKYINNMGGKVNSLACRLPGSPQTFAPETLLFEGMDDEITISYEDTEQTRQLTLRFTEKAQHFLETGTDGAAGAGTIYGWNHQFREDTGAYDKPVDAVSGNPLFQTIDFNGLWTATE